MSPSRKQRSRAMALFLATAAAMAIAAPGAFAATTVTYNAGGTSPGMNVTDDPGNAALRMPRGTAEQQQHEVEWPLDLRERLADLVAVARRVHQHHADEHSRQAD